MLIKSEHNGHLLEHDEEEHIYKLDGKFLTGVTTILGGGYPKSQFLIDWQIKQGARWSLAEWDQLGCDGGKFEEIVKESPKAYKIELNKAADIGTVVHDYMYHTEAKKPFNLKEHLEQFDTGARKATFTALRQGKKWLKENADEILGLELLVCSPKYLFAGRFDRLSNRKGVITLTDYKTSSGFYITQFIQLAAYCIALEEWLGIIVEDIEIVRFDKKTGKLTTRNLAQLANTVGLKSETTLKRLKDQFKIILDTVKFKEKFDKYIRK